MQRIGQQHKITEHFYRQTRRDITAAGLSAFGEGLTYGHFPRPNSSNPISSVDDSRSDYRQFSIPEQTLTKQNISDPRFEVVEAMWDLPIDYPLQFSNLILSNSTPKIGTQKTSTTQDTLSIRSIEKTSDSIPGSSANSNQIFHTQPALLLPMREHEQVFTRSDRGHNEGAPGLNELQMSDFAIEYPQSHIVNHNYYSKDLFDQYQ